MLVALGLAVTYGTMGVINMAHGEMVMLGAYATVFTEYYLHLSIIAAIPLAFGSSLPGWSVSPSSGSWCGDSTADCSTRCWRPGGVAILIQQAVRLELGVSFFGLHIPGLGPGLQNVTVPRALTGALTILGVEINAYRLFIHRRHGGAGRR